MFGKRFETTGKSKVAYDWQSIFVMKTTVDA